MPVHKHLRVCDNSVTVARGEAVPNPPELEESACDGRPEWLGMCEWELAPSRGSLVTEDGQALDEAPVRIPGCAGRRGPRGTRFVDRGTGKAGTAAGTRADRRSSRRRDPRFPLHRTGAPCRGSAWWPPAPPPGSATSQVPAGSRGHLERCCWSDSWHRAPAGRSSTRSKKSALSAPSV